MEEPKSQSLVVNPQYNQIKNKEIHDQLCKEVAERAGFSTLFASYKMDGFHKKTQNELIHFISNSQGARSIYLAGQVGVGKTAFLSTMLQCLFRAWAHNEEAAAHLLPAMFSQNVYFISHKNIIDIVHDEYRADGRESLTVSDIENIGLLIIDDLISAHDTPHNVAALESIIEYRWRHRVMTWITSNISKKDLFIKSRYPDWQRIASRLFDTSWMEYVEIIGKDRRRITDGNK